MLEQQYKLSSYTDKSLKTIQKSLDLGRDRLLKYLGNRDFRLPEGREHMILQELNDLTLGIQMQLTGDIKEAAIKAGEMSLREYNNILSFDGKLAETVGFELVSVSPSQFAAMVAAPVGGEILEAWVKQSFSSHIIDDIQAEILAGNFTGTSTPKIIDRLVDSFGMIRHDAETLVRTQIATTNNLAAQMVYKANADIINRVRWDSTFEVSTKSGSSTCMVCAALHGQEFDVNEPHPIPPKHLRCRCYMTPITKSWQALGLNIDEMKSALKPFTERASNRKILDVGQMSGSFDDFLKTRNKKYQVNFLGSNRYAMWKNGEFKVEDLIDSKGNLRLLTKDKDGNYVGLMGKSSVVKSVVLKPSFQPAKDIKSVLTELKATRTPTGVYLDGIPKRHEASILAGLNDSVYQYGGKLNSVGWQLRKQKSLGIAAYTGDFIQFQKSGIKSIYKTAPESRDIFESRRLKNIEDTKKLIADPKNKNILNHAEITLKKLEDSTMWAAYTKAADPLKAIAAHEGFHNVYYTHKLKDSFSKNLAKNGITDRTQWFKVSEYGASAETELFAEIGSAITNDLKIPNEFVKAFNDTVKEFKK